MCGAKRAERAVAVSNQSAPIRSRPQRPIARRQQRVHAVVGKRGFVPCIEHDEPNAVEPGKATARADPQIAVGRLRECLREIFGEAIGALPDAAAVEVGAGIGRRNFSVRVCDA